MNRDHKPEVISSDDLRKQPRVRVELGIDRQKVIVPSGEEIQRPRKDLKTELRGLREEELKSGLRADNPHRELRLKPTSSSFRNVKLQSTAPTRLELFKSTTSDRILRPTTTTTTSTTTTSAAEEAEYDADVDPCDPNAHHVISNQPQRSFNHHLSLGGGEPPICDRNLRRGWYRFQSPAGGIMPTECPGGNYCGTNMPVWMKGA